MSCINCEDVPKRINNIYRDEELKEKFENITGLVIYQNVFICDNCYLILNQSHSFKEKCIVVYEREFSKYVPNNLKTEIEAYEQLENNLDSSNIDSQVLQEEHLEDEENYESYVIDDPLQNSQENNQKKVRLRYSLKEKIRAIEMAEQTSNRQAAKILSIDESCIRKWRHVKDQLKSKDSQDECKLSKLELNTLDTLITTESLEIDDTETECEIQTEIVEEIMPENNVKEVKTRKSYSSGQKLEVVAFAEVTGNRQAAKIFKIDESCIRKWRNQKDMLIEINNERRTMRKPNLRFPEVESRLKAFVNQKLDIGIILRPSEIKAESIRIAKELNIKNFKGTSSYIFKFMERYHFPSSRSKKANKTTKQINEVSAEISVDIL